MTTNHTPGPWVRDTGSGFGCDVRAENGRKVAATWGINNGDPHRPAYRAECDANARLIAAAPDYHDAAGWILAAVATNAAPVNALAALEEMALDGKHVTLDAGLVLDLLKAHAKAKGEQQ
jgi:hypothetical protein